jgi:hypothetical protein
MLSSLPVILVFSAALVGIMLMGTAIFSMRGKSYPPSLRDGDTGINDVGIYGDNDSGGFFASYDDCGGSDFGDSGEDGGGDCGD